MNDRATEIPKTKGGMKRKRKLNLNTVTGWIFIIAGIIWYLLI